MVHFRLLQQAVCTMLWKLLELGTELTSCRVRCGLLMLMLPYCASRILALWQAQISEPWSRAQFIPSDSLVPG